ncbi:MBL fold metallo-hydrolase [Paenibacillus thermotolerans]|uniref:MBL fold metallo-hydrolase n=1 Tax=Paenibacillus thermotolerans TaxID=3027807 RepID=UPI0023689F96|nr:MULTISPECIES: MBL fold metallo-hydrolase [unclassified Paenibacillus]
MRIVKQSDVTQLTTLPNLFPVNCYLVEEESSLTLIDAAMPFSAAGIIAEVKRRGKPLTHIALTHAHEDHVGALDRLKAEFPDALVAISERDARLMSGDRSLEPGEADAPIRGGVPKKLRTRPDVLLSEGDKIGSLRAVCAPGHTPGLMAFLDERSNALIVGDAFQTQGRLAVAGQTVWSFPFPKFGTWDAATSLQSAKKLLKLTPSLLAPGHGNMLPQPAEAMERAILQAERALEGEMEHGAKAGS